MEKKESRSELLIYNILVFGLSTVISKLMTFILSPIYTRYFTPEEYGVFDLTIIIVSIVQIISLLGITEAVFRLYFDKDDMEHRSTVISTGLKLVFFSTLGASIAVLLLNDRLAVFFLGDVRFVDYINLGIVLIFLINITSVTQAIVRMENNRKLIVQITLIQAFITLVLSVFFVVVLGLDLRFVLAVKALSLFIVFVITYNYGKKYINLNQLKPDKEVANNIFRYGLPLIPVFIGYWIMGGADRMMLNHFIGTGAVGLYAIGSKLSQIMNLFQVIFAKGWQYFGYSTMTSEDAPRLYGKIFDFIVLIGLLGTTFLLFYSDFLFMVLFSASYYEAWIVSPILAVGPILMVLRWISAIGYFKEKKTYIDTASVMIAVIVNLALNYILIQYYGILGAAIATLIAYIALLTATYSFGSRYLKIDSSNGLLLVSCLLLASSFFVKYMYLEKLFLYSTSAFLIYAAIYCLIYKHSIKEAYAKFKPMIKKTTRGLP